MSNPHSSKRTIEELMLEKQILSAEQLEKAKNIQAQTLERLEDIIVRLGFLVEKDVLDLWAEFLGVTVVDLTNIKVDAKILSLIPEYQAKQYKVIPYKKTNNRLTVVMADPFDIMAQDMIAFLTQCKLDVLIAPKAQIELAIKQLYSWEGFSVAGDESMASSGGEGESGVDVVRRTSEEGPVVQFLNAIFKQAILKRASDIHIEPREDILLVRFRIDGILHDALTGPKSLVAPLISRVKILSHLDIAERRLPQDGRLKVKMESHEIDFRVSTVPSLIGEKAVLRILQREASFDLDNIGFLPEDLDRLKSVMDEPYGMILVTGPTGAGKTTTLFGMLKYFNSSEINIFTIENPIEYRIDGITQVQTNEKINLDFAHGLRAALRQDPDVILVGEIRDLETAEIAFRASLTGHKVLSTLHTNNAAASITRLIDMGVPAYLVTAAVRTVIAQKLLHRICPHCRTEYRPSPKTIQRLKLPPNKIMGSKFYKGTGCKHCNQSGVYGRQGVYEVFMVTPAIRDVIIDGGGQEATIKRVARLGGMKTLREIAIMRALEGACTLEEVLYVTPSDDEGQGLGAAGLAAVLGRGAGTTLVVPGNVVMPAGVTEGGAMAGSSGGQGQLDMNDPVVRSLMARLEEEFLFFSDEDIATKLQMSLLQVQESRGSLGLTRDRDGFQKRFGRFPEELGEDDALGLVEDVQERQGRLPEFLFEEEASGTLFAKVVTKQALKLLSGRVTDAELIPAAFSSEFCAECGLDQAVAWAGGSRFKLVEMVMPGRYKPWQFGQAEEWLTTGDLGDRTREALEWLITTKLGCSRGDLPQMLTAEVMRECGLEPLLRRHGNSVYKMVQGIYPGVFQPWQFIDEEAVIWFREDRYEIARTATRWLVESRLAIPVEEIPRRLTLRDFHQNNLSKLLDLFNQNLFHVVDNAYPNKFKPWEYSEQGDLWRSADGLEKAREATLWLIDERLQWEKAKAPSQLTRRHFLNNGLGWMVGTLFNHSPFVALENCFEELKNNEIFQKALFAYAQEVRDMNTRWQALAEKIALNHFGKAKFKVTLPNLKVAPIVPETESIYYNAANQIEYVPQIVVAKLGAYDDFSDFSNWVPYCDRLLYWVLADDRAPGYAPPSHPKVKLVFVESLIGGLRTKGLLDVVEKVNSLKTSFDRLLDRKAPSGM
ncbi:MAG TPA: GspE/PulE family protein [Candidatus Ozemobacteraceae bacterium]|nr:GspE/PulE family protein [Candidatus Ozemobacteraceae bacterium]